MMLPTSTITIKKNIFFSEKMLSKFYIEVNFLTLVYAALTPDVFSKKIKIFFDFEGPKIDVAAAINLALAKLLLNRRHSISKEN